MNAVAIGAYLPASLDGRGARLETHGAETVAGQISDVRVVPNDVAASYLINKLTGTGGICGVRMPQGGPYLSTADVDKIRAWINRGAPND